MNLKKLKWLIPLLSLLVIFESVLIIQKLGKNELEEASSGVEEMVAEEDLVSISFSGIKEISEGETGEISAAMRLFKNVFLDGADILIEYDPEYLEIVGTAPSDKFSYLAKNWIEPEKKRILISMVETEIMEGVYFTAGEEVNLVTIEYIALKPGETTLKIIGGKDEVGTVLAENGTARKIPFSKEEFILNIN